MKKELQSTQIAKFALGTNYEDIENENIEQLKRHLLDALASMIHATTRPAINTMVNQLRVLGERGKCKVPLLESLAFDRAAQLYTALIRYPDFMDNFMGKESTCHPSDNIGPLLAAAQFKPTSGKEFLTAMAVAYEIECRLVLEIPVMKEGIDHTLLLGYSMVGAVSKLIGLSEEHTAHALAIAGTSISPIVTSRASYTSMWKGFASSLEAFNCINIVLLAQQGMTGPLAIFEGPKGFKEIFGMDLDYDWSKDKFDLIRKCVLKEYNAEVHSQATLEAVIDLKNENNFNAADIEKINITTFLTAYHIIGGGAYGDRKTVHSKEQADHSLFYLTAVALLDGDVYPEQFETERIERKDVQDLLQKVSVNTGFPLHKPLLVAGILDPYTEAYPGKMKAKAEIKLKNGKTFEKEKEDYYGFFTRPFDWNYTIKKFTRLTSGVITFEKQQQIVDVVQNLENQSNINKLIELICIQ